MSRLLAAGLATALLAVLGAGGASAAGFRWFSVDGPKVVHVGQQVRFPTRGLRPNERVQVSLVPTLNRGGNCCGIDVIRRARADAHGEAILHFRWPASYFNGSARVAWTPGARVDVIVLADSGRGRRVVRVATG